MKISKEHNTMLLFDLLAENSNIFHFMTTRLGGVSQGEYASFNLGEFAGDDPDMVFQNRVLLSAQLEISVDSLVFPYQTHQDKILKIDDEFLMLSTEKRKEGSAGYDAVVTDVPGVCIGVTTADCVPLIAYDPVCNVLAAIHAGWRGTVAKIASKTIQFMMSNYNCKGSNIQVGIGACISMDRFEVGEEVVEAFRLADIPLDKVSYRNPTTGKCHIDLQLVNKMLLENEGVIAEKIELMPLCTQDRDDLFFSARRQGVKSGRMVTGGMIRPTKKKESFA